MARVSWQPTKANIRLFRVKWVGLVLLVFVALLNFLVMAFLIHEVSDDLSSLGAASSDNVQWTLSQTEVEYLKLRREVEIAAFSTTPRAERVRQAYDIFYSRITTLTHGSLYEGLIKTDEYHESLKPVQDFLAKYLPYIDGEDRELVAILPTMNAEMNAVQKNVRILANAGLFKFAMIADEQRGNVSRTLLRLAGVTAAILIILALLAVYFNSLYRQNLARGLALQNANNHLQTILSTSLDAIVVTDRKGRILDFNKAAEVIFDHKKDNVIYRDFAELIIPPHLREAHRIGMRRVEMGGERRVVGRGRVRLEAMRATGEVFPVEMALQSAHHGENEIFIAFLRDISRLIESEEELVNARDRALAGEKAKANFLAVMSHEIRTPLNGLLGSLSLMRNTRLTARQTRHIENMEISGKLLLNQVNMVLDITKFEAGKLEIEHAHADLNKLLQSVIDNQEALARSGGNTLSWGWSGPPMPYVKTDAARLQQVLLNLVGNAVKFTRNGHIEMIVKVLTPADVEPMYEIRVNDSGSGIPTEDLARIFEDFETRDSSYGRAVGGTGLGLGIARRIASAMGGDIGAQSELGSGSSFWVRLPMAPSDRDEIGNETVQTIGFERKLRILVVEDNEINRQVVNAMLSHDGHSVNEATDGHMGVQMAAAEEYDLILMDISMPTMDGLQATQHIRASDGVNKTTPIIALTANVMPEETKKFAEHGMDGYISKPLNLNSLRAEFVRILSHEETTPVTKTKKKGRTFMIDHEQNQDMRESIGEDAYGMMLDRFLSEGQETVDWICGAVTASTPNYDELIAVSHKIASSAAIFGAVPLREGFLSVEISAKSKDAAGLRKNADLLRVHWDTTISILREMA